MRKSYLIACLFSNLIFACKNKTSPETNAPAAEAGTPVTVTSFDTLDLADFVDLNATASYQQSNFIKAPAAGYLTSVNVKVGQPVYRGQFAFTLQTKEAYALGNTINKLDSSFHFSGIIRIKSSAGGFIQSVDHQPGDFVMEGEQLAVIADNKSFGFILNLPVELRRYINVGKKVEIDMPDRTSVSGIVSNIMPTVDSISQTQNVLIKVNMAARIPQNLIAKVRIVKAQKINAITLPKDAVLTDEAQTNFWVMKMIDSVTAVKVPVIKGMETKDKVEILSPPFSPDDKIVLTGNYGLPDTAIVKIMKEVK